MVERPRGPASPALRELNRLPWERAVERLRSCCAAERWARAVADRRPFADVDSLLQSSDEVWAGLGEPDCREAIAHHPRLGGGDLAARRFDETRAQSRREQAAVLGADERTRAALARAQRQYERRFGIIFLICTSGRPAAEILAELERRMSNDHDVELTVVAEELRKITRLRLARTFGSSPDSDPRPEGG